MRKVKCRGKRIDNGEWVYGYYVFECRNNNHLIFTNKIGAYNPGFEPKKEDYILESYEIIPETVGQYTGLKDKNGVKIYEGDILESLAGVFVVEWIDDITRFCICWCVNKKLYDKIPLTKELAEMAEVIGNIHDNPELLEVQS
jgi:uncharacterized phage protein (TIGR01671 family)